MATSGREIKKANFTSSATRDIWHDTHSNKDQHRFLYICSPAWKIKTDASYAVFGNFGVAQYRFRYYNGTSWVNWQSFECGAGGGNIAFLFACNIDDGFATNGVFKDGGYPLWEIEYWPSRSNNRWGIHVIPYTWGSVTPTSLYPQGKKIYSIGRSSDCLHSTGTRFSGLPFGYPNARTGSPILASNEKELVTYKWLW